MERVVLRLNSRRPFSSFFELHLEGSGPREWLAGG
jgi:hypothetical protein